MAKRTRGRPRRGQRDGSSLDDAYLSAVNEASGEPGAQDEGDAVATADVNKKQFGRLGSAWMIIDVTDDGQEALLTELSFGGDSALDAETVEGALGELYFITTGVNRDLVRELALRASASPGSMINGSFPIARGIAPTAGEDGRVELPFMDKLPGDSRLSTEVERAFERTELAAVLESETLAYASFPGEELARVVAPSEGDPGTDVFGNRRTLRGEPAVLAAGPFVKESGDRFTSTIYGYVCLVDEVLSVVPPIWVGPDRLEAHFIWFSQAGPPRPPQSDWLLSLLEARGVVHGIEEPSLEKLPKLDDDSYATSICVARGSAAASGEDAHIDYTFDAQQWAGKILPDGSVDLRERNSGVSVRAGDLLGELKPATEGTPGMDLAGEEIATTDGQERSFKAGDNVREESDGDAVKYYSEIDGNVHIKGEAIQVNPVFVVSGDIDYETGNIDVGTDVQISGSVKSGFTVKAGGSVTVGAVVESGATVNAQGDIIVAQGILGETTKVIALGNIESKFIQNAAVMTRGDIVVGSYIFSGHVRAGGRVSVQTAGGDRGGSIIGGEVFGTNGVEAKLIGSASTDRTVVGVGANPEDSAKLRKLKEVIEFCDTSSLRLMRTLGLRSMDGAQLKSIIQRAPAAKREFLIEAVKKLKHLIDTKQKTEKSRDDLQGQISEALSKAQITASDRVFADVQIHMGDNKVTVSKEIERPLFLMTQEGIRCRPQQ